MYNGSIIRYSFATEVVLFEKLGEKSGFDFVIRQLFDE